MAEEEKKEVLGQEKDMDVNELDAVAGGIKMAEGERLCKCLFAGNGEYMMDNKPGCLCVLDGYGEGMGL